MYGVLLYVCTADTKSNTKNQKTNQVDDVRLEAGHQKLDYENFMDDDEVTLHRRKKDTDVTDISGPDARDDLDTEREDWLLRAESLQGARPKKITRE